MKSHLFEYFIISLSIQEIEGQYENMCDNVMTALMRVYFDLFVCMLSVICQQTFTQAFTGAFRAEK